MTARANILRKVDDALADVPAESWKEEIPRAYLRSAPPDIEEFLTHNRAYGTRVHRVTPDQLAATVAQVVAGHHARTLAAPGDAPKQWLAAIPMTTTVLPDTPGAPIEPLAAVDVSITGCAVAVAKTGGFAVNGGPTQGRRLLSLLPDRHIVVIMASQIVGTLAEALQHLTPDRPAAWIAGPSITADIELTRVDGAHGPRTLDMILVEDH
ncbi:lactate utilization protein C [Streptomyces gamaensis]|uniref:Lactate utilization protein C n=1 Tax=Streptomyces gamaensis TaxID=1763542 RepID=A0ABW0Z5V7_9ACTN